MNPILLIKKNNKTKFLLLGLLPLTVIVFALLFVLTRGVVSEPVLEMSKTDWQTNELPQFVFKTPTGNYQDFKVKGLSLKDAEGRVQLLEQGTDFEIEKEYPFAITLKQPSSFKPGKYTLEAVIEANEKEYVFNQEFTWGALAINSQEQTLAHFKWEKSGRIFTAEKPNQYVYKSFIGQSNVDLGNNQYAPYVWNAKEKTLKFGSSELKLNSETIEFFNSGEKLNTLNIYPEVKENNIWQKKPAIISEPTIEEIDNSGPRVQVKLSYRILTEDQESTISLLTGSSDKVQFDFNIKSLKEAEQRLTVEFAEKGEPIIRQDKQGRKLEPTAYSFGKSVWSWLPEEQDTRQIEQKADQTRIKLAEKFYRQNETIRIYPDTWGATGIQANADDGYEEDIVDPEWLASGYENLIYLGRNDDWGAAYFYGGFRWAAITIPSGSTIDETTMRIYARPDEGGGLTGKGSPQANVQAWDTNDAGQFSDGGNMPGNVSTTTASVNWVFSNPTTTGWKTSPDFKSVTQEIFDDYGLNNKAINYVLMGGLGSSGEDYMSVEDYSHAETNEAELTITYTAPAEIIISGTIYTDQANTTSSQGSIIHLAINGSSTATTTASTTNGSYVFEDLTRPATSAPITVFIDDTQESGAVITKYSGTGNIENLDIYLDHIIVRHEDQGPITNQDIGHYATSTPYSVSSGPPYVLEADSGHTLFVFSGKTYQPSWDVFTPYLQVQGTLKADSTTITIQGSGTPFVVNGTFTADTSNVSFEGVSTATVPALTFYNLETNAATGSPTYILASGNITINNDFSLKTSDSAASMVQANTNDPAITVKGNFTISSGQTFQSSNSSELKLEKNFENSGAFTHNSGTVIFLNSSATSTLSGATTFYNLTSTTTNKVLEFATGTSATTTIEGTLTLNGQSCNTPIVLRSTENDSAWHLNVAGASATASIQYADVKDSNAAGSDFEILADNSYDSEGNTNWNIDIGTCDIQADLITISGTVFESDTTATSTQGSVIHLAINGASTATTTASTTNGSYVFEDLTQPATSAPITVFIDDTQESGAVITRYQGSGNIENLDVYDSYIILTHQDQGPITNQDIFHYATSTPYSVSSGPSYVLEADSGHTLFVFSGKTYQPSWDVFTPYLQAQGTLKADSTTITIQGSGTPFVVNGTFTADTSNVSFEGVSTATIPALTFYDLSIGNTESSNDVTFNSAGDIAIDNDLAIQLGGIKTGEVGRDWIQATSSAQWAAREGHVSLVYDNKIWVIAGYDDSYLNDVWYSSDGVSWTQATSSAQWARRWRTTALVYDDKMWIIGGQDSDWLPMNDVWHSTDGVSWTQATSSANWAARDNHTSLVFDAGDGDRMWVIGGDNPGSGNLNDVWYSADGISWTQATSSADWAAKAAHSSLVYNNYMWVIAGSANPRSVYYSSDGINWTWAVVDADFPDKKWHTSLVYDNKMWVIGGGYNDIWHNDVWHSTSGVNWTQATSSAQWSARPLHSSVVFKNKMWVIGGGHGGTIGYFNDVWYSGEEENFINTFVAPSGSLTVGGNFTNNSQLAHSSGTVIFVDSSKESTLSGETTFYNLTSTTTNKTLQFTSGASATTTIAGTLTLDGQYCETPILLRSSSEGSQWYLNLTGAEATTSIQHTDIKDSNAEGSDFRIPANNSYKSGNNTNWNIKGGVCVPNIYFKGRTRIKGQTIIR